MNVANILPGDEIKVELKYNELLVPTEGSTSSSTPPSWVPVIPTGRGDGAPAENDWVQNPYLHAGESPTCPFDIHADIAAGMADQASWPAPPTR